MGLLDDPSAHATCLGLALVAAFIAWRCRRPGYRSAWAILAVVVGFTSPWLARLNQAWFGAFPTIDKEGSLLFFLDGVHRRLYLNPTEAPLDDAVRLIGVHAGHLWITELFATLLTPMGAFNLQWLLSAGLAWWAASWAIRTLLATRDPQPSAIAAFAAGFPFGMGLHFFRDLDVTTVEKGGTAFIALFVGCWVHAARTGGRWVLALGGCYALMALYNLYFALVCAGFGALHALVSLHRPTRDTARRLGACVLACAVPGVLVALWQLWVQSGGPAIATPERFLWERAALDGVTIWPLQWNRLELWRACNPVALGLAGFGAYRLRSHPVLWKGICIAVVLTVISVGPVLVPGPELDAPRLTNPLYMALHKLVPGFWRVAKPEVFFQPVWLLVLTTSAVGLQALLARRRPLGMVAIALLFLAWWPLVRAHPAFPGMSAPLESELNPTWRQTVFETEATAP